LITDLFSWAVVLLILLASAIMLTNRDWRIQLGALAMEYLAAFWLVTRHLPFAIGSAKLVSGWMVVATLGVTRLSLSTNMEESETLGPRGQRYPAILIGVVALAAAGATPRIEAVIPGMGLQVIAGGLLLIGVSLIQLGLSADIFRVILGLLTMLIGFEIIYAAVENSILVAGLLAVTNLGLGLVGSYLLIADSPSRSNVEEEELL
jgi:hypothetical protein